MNVYFFVFAFNAKSQDGRQKWRENYFWGKSPVDSADTPEVKDFVEFALSSTIIKINALLQFTQKFKMAAKKSRQQTLQIPCGSKMLSKLLYLALFPR